MHIYNQQGYMIMTKESTMQVMFLYTSIYIALLKYKEIYVYVVIAKLQDSTLTQHCE